MAGHLVRLDATHIYIYVLWGKEMVQDSLVFWWKGYNCGKEKVKRETRERLSCG